MYKNVKKMFDKPYKFQNKNKKIIKIKISNKVSHNIKISLTLN